MDSTQWLTYLSTLLSSACRVSRELSAGRSVLVHCSDGWDRTPQIVSLAEIILDPYYRTLKGFQVLVDREWLCFGHKFADRCGNPPNAGDLTERSPIFLQWLDCVYQLMSQQPMAFEFTETFLLKLLSHVYSNMFGTFMCNSLQERVANLVFSSTRSVWPMLMDIEQNRNVLFDESRYKTLKVLCSISHLQPWRRAYTSREFNVTSVQPGNEVFQNVISNASKPKSAAIAIPKQSSPAATRYDQKADAYSFEGKSPIVTHLSCSTDSMLVVAPSLHGLSPQPSNESSSSPLKNGFANGIANMLNNMTGMNNTSASPTIKEADFSLTAVDRTDDEGTIESDDEFQQGEDTLPLYIDPVQEAAREKLSKNTAKPLCNENTQTPVRNGMSTSLGGKNLQMRLSGSSPDVTGCDYVQPDVRAEVPASWLPDSLFPYCSSCKKEFGVLRGRHHCRLVVLLILMMFIKVIFFK